MNSKEKEEGGRGECYVCFVCVVCYAFNYA